MDKKLREKGLVIIGEESYGSEKDAVEAISKKLGLTFAVTQGTAKPPNMEFEPHAAVFDKEGKLVFSAAPEEGLDEAIHKALGIEDAGDEPAGALIPSRDWTNTGGKTITAEVIEFVDAETVRFRLPDGRETNFPTAKLSAPDRALIEEKRKAAAE